MTPQAQMDHTHATGPLAVVTSLLSALLSHLVAMDAALHALSSLIAIVAGAVSITHYVRQWLKR
jgi:hypothetical protein